MNDDAEIKSDGPRPVIERATPRRAAWSFYDYFWFVLKNVLGWIFMLGSPVLGVVVPGPGGIPLFLLGFALVTFPGKRKITSRMMRGRPMQVDPGIFTAIATIASVGVTALVIWLLIDRYKAILKEWDVSFLGIFGICALAAGVTWLMMRVTVALVNWILRSLPRVRRFIRPWLRKYGINLLPPRRKRHISSGQTIPHHDRDEILRFSDKYRTNFTAVRIFLIAWAKRAMALTLTVLIFYYIFKPVTQNWPEVKNYVLLTNKLLFVATAGMFAIFLFAFRAITWWRILARLGHRIPLGPALRIWATSELVRYVPGSVLQFVGRAYLAKPYGINASLCSASQILELVIFLLANILIAVPCLLYFGLWQLSPAARYWLFAVAGLIPLLILLLNPKVFYPLVNRILARFGKASVPSKLRRRDLVALTFWNVVGLLWQSLAVWLITKDALQLPIQKWWLVAGAYCLAWCAGFLAVWAPGGIGVREIVFVAAMDKALPLTVRDTMTSPETRAGVLAILALVLRLWTITGELILTAVAYLIDFRGATGDPQAPGRKRIESTSRVSSPPAEAGGPLITISKERN